MNLRVVFDPERAVPFRRAALAGVIALGAALGPVMSVAQDQPVTVETLRLTPEAPMIADTFFGSVTARDITSLSYGARGCVVAISEQAKRERRVRQGEVLIRLDDQRIKLALLTAEARLLELGAVVDERQIAIDAAIADERRRAQELALATEEFERSKAMLSRGLINETAMDTVERRFLDANFTAERAREAIQSAEAAMKRAEIALEIGKLDRQLAAIDLEKLVLAAPFDGILVGFDANVGDCVQEGALLARVHEPDQKSVDVYLQISRLTGPYASSLAIGADVSVLRGNGQDCGGTISRIDSEADLENQLVRVTVDVDPACAGDLFLNESVEIAVVQDGGADSFVVPNSAFRGDGTLLLVDEETRRLIAVTGDVVFRGAAQSSVLLPGAAGRLLVVNGGAGLAEGLLVETGTGG